MGAGQCARGSRPLSVNLIAGERMRLNPAQPTPCRISCTTKPATRPGKRTVGENTYVSAAPSEALLHISQYAPRMTAASARVAANAMAFACEVVGAAPASEGRWMIGAYAANFMNWSWD